MNISIIVVLDITNGSFVNIMYVTNITPGARYIGDVRSSCRKVPHQ